MRHNLPGPGDFLPPDPEELPDYYLELACEQLNAEEEEPHWTVNDQEVIDRGWELYDEAKRQAEQDRAEMAAWEREDELGR